MTTSRVSRTIALLLLTPLVGCGKAPPATETPEAPPAAVAAPAGPQEEHVKIGGVSIDRGSNVALPAGFPADVPLPADAKLTDAVEMGNIHVVAFSVPTPPDATFAALLTLYQGQGWKNYSRIDGQPVMGTDGFDKDGRKLIYTVVPDGSGSKVNLRIYPKAG